MAYITFNPQKLKSNYKFLDKLFSKKKIKWAVVSKLLCGNKIYLEELLKLGISQICDSRVYNLKAIKAINPDIETMYVRPPAKNQIPNIIKYADISLNSESYTIQLLSNEAIRQNKTHKIIIMIELGDLREGILGEKLIGFYEKVFNLPNIEIVGIGTNLSCLNGVLPNNDKLIQLSLYKQLIEAKFNKKIKYVSGGSSVTIPLIFQKLLPEGINHFRVGETLFLGTNVYDNSDITEMHRDVFKLFASIIEIVEKPMIPTGELTTNVAGTSQDFDKSLIGKTSKRAIIDLGLLDIEDYHLFPLDEKINIVGASSDMMVVDLGNNPDNYKTGDVLEFNLDYMGVLKIMNSSYIEKRVVY